VTAPDQPARVGDVSPSDELTRKKYNNNNNNNCELSTSEALPGVGVEALGSFVDNSVNADPAQRDARGDAAGAAADDHGGQRPCRVVFLGRHCRCGHRS